MTTLAESASALPGELAREMTCATEAIRRTLAGLAPGSRLSLESLLAAFRGVHRVSELRRAGKPAGLKTQNAEDLRAEAEYRAALAGWERHLPRLHGWLLAERARLGSRSGHAHLVRAWIDADQQTR